MKPAWSPDGTTIAFTRSSDGRYDVFAINADGTALRNLTNTPGLDAGSSWSPDGSKIAFDTNRAGILDIYVMNADGTDQRPIATARSAALTLPGLPTARRSPSRNGSGLRPTTTTSL